MTPRVPDDDDDWVGEPPEGRHTREQSNAGYWTNQKPLVVSVFFFGMAVLIVVVVILAT